MRYRTAKTLAQPADVDWLTRPHPLRRWRSRLSIAVPAVALLWLAGMDATGNRAPYSRGPVSTAHAFLENRCETCHVPRNVLRAPVTDAACLACHDAPPHHLEQTVASACATCHRDHQGRVRLAETADVFCVRCHGQLEPARGPMHVARTVRGFPASHPEFAAAMPGARDPGTLAFNHQLHLQDGLAGPEGPGRLTCDSCHTPEVVRVSSQGRFTTGHMAPIDFRQHCARCHALPFTDRFPGQAPHAEPIHVRAAIRQAFLDYITAHPREAATAEGTGDGSLRVPLWQPAERQALWADRQTALAERQLWESTCAKCHLLTDPRPRDHLPIVASAGTMLDWMPSARFNHSPHAAIACTSCHRADSSRQAADVLMPGGRICATCHAPGLAASQCSQCHAYHDWTRARPVQPVLALPGRGLPER